MIYIDARPAQYNTAGIGRYLRSTLDALQRAGEADLPCTLLTDSHDFPIRSSYWRIENIPATGARWHWEVWQRLRTRSDVVYFSPSSLLVPSFLSHPSVVVVHDLSAVLFPQVHSWKTQVAERLLLKPAVRRAHNIVTPSQSTKDALCKHVKLDPDKVVVIPHGFDPVFSPRGGDHFSSLSQYLQQEYPHCPILCRGDYFLFVGTFEPRKNISRLLGAFAAYRQQGGSKFLVIVGRRGWKYESVFQRYHALGLEECVFFLEGVDAQYLPMLYASAFAFVYPSLYEGFGFPVLEAMASGCPVVTSRCSSLPEVGGDAVSYIDPQEEGDIAQALCRLEQSPQLWASHREKGLDQAKRFSWEASVAGLSAVLRGVVH